MARKNLYPPSVTPGIPRLSELPDGWTRTTFGNVLCQIIRPASIADDQEYRLVTAKRGRGGIVPRSILTGRDILTKTQFCVKEGDFLISKRQIIHGACGVVPHELDGAIVSGEYSILRTRDGLSMDYLEGYRHTVHFQQTVFQSSVGVDVEKMIFNLDEWFRYEVDLPPLPEQHKIAAILGTWDEAIRLTAELIAAKQQRKKGLMQRLLTGEVRFPGFEGRPWREVELADITEIIVSNVDKKLNPAEKSVRLCNYTDVFKNAYILNSMTFMEGSATPAEINRFGLRKHDVIITKDSETAEEIAEAAVVIEELNNVVCGYHLAILRPDPQQAFGPFLNEMLHHVEVRQQFVRNANGITRYGLTQATIREAKLRMPGIEEQIKISTVLQASYREIDLLQQKLAALRQQKKGLMQRLLTGQIRVAVGEDGAAGSGNAF